MTSRLTETVLLDSEGKASLTACVNATLQYCRDHGIEKVVMFTATGEGPLHAVMEPPDGELDVRVIAVSPPAGKAYLADPQSPESGRVLAGIPEVTRRVLDDWQIPVISAHLPFQGPPGLPGEHGPPSEWARVERAYAVLGGGFSLCIQAIMMACDAGHVMVGERVAAMTAATAIVAIATRTDLFLSPTHGLLVEGWICRPAKYDISHSQHHRFPSMATQSESPPKQLTAHKPDD